MGLGAWGFRGTPTQGAAMPVADVEADGKGPLVVSFCCGSGGFHIQDPVEIRAGDGNQGIFIWVIVETPKAKTKSEGQAIAGKTKESKAKCGQPFSWLLKHSRKTFFRGRDGWRWCSKTST